MLNFKYGETELSHLRARDEKLAAYIAAAGMIEREVNPDPFSALIESVIRQQISIKAAATVNLRLLDLLGGFDPERVFLCDPQAMRQCGLSERKVGYIKGIAGEACSGRLDFSRLSELSNEEVIARLSALNGVGVWTCEMLLIFSLQRPDVLSWGDLGIRRGLMRLHGLDALTREQFGEFREHYSPYCSTASLYLWKLAQEDA